MMDETFISDGLFEKETEQPAGKIKDIKKFFDLANDNVRSATEIFNKCVEMKKKLENDSKELELRRLEHTEKTEQEIDKVNKVKEEVFSKLKVKKAEIDDELTAVKEEKLVLSNERNRFEIEKKNEYLKLKEEKAKQEKELLEKNKELDKEKKQLEIERQKLEEDKIKANEKADELAVNLNRFNDLVKQFTSGINL